MASGEKKLRFGLLPRGDSGWLGLVQLRMASNLSSAFGHVSRQNKGNDQRMQSAGAHAGGQTLLVSTLGIVDGVTNRSLESRGRVSPVKSSAHGVLGNQKEKEYREF